MGLATPRTRIHTYTHTPTCMRNMQAPAHSHPVEQRAPSMFQVRLSALYVSGSALCSPTEHPPPMQPGDEVAVTGASGYVAGHVIKSLLDKGYTVRGTVRSLNDTEKVNDCRPPACTRTYPT